MDRTGVFVDAGYLFAAGSILLSGEKLRRGEVNLTNDAFFGVHATESPVADRASSPENLLV